jgi:hypothetical protein
MAVLDVDEIETSPIGQYRGFDKTADDLHDLTVGQDWVVRADAEAGVEQGMVIENPGLQIRPIRAGETTRVRELKTDQ